MYNVIFFRTVNPLLRNVVKWSDITLKILQHLLKRHSGLEFVEKNEKFRKGFLIIFEICEHSFLFQQFQKSICSGGFSAII